MKAKRENIRIRLVGKGITPASISVTTMAKTVEAVQALLHGEKSDGDASSLQLVNVRTGSAVYVCKSDNAIEAASRVRNLQALIDGDSTAHIGMETLSPLKRLSQIAKAKQCAVHLIIEGRTKPTAIIDENTYPNVENRVIAYDEVIVSGRLIRVGGATERKCGIRVPGRDGLLYCSVETEELSKKLGELIYSELTVSGKGSFISRNWYLVTMIVSSVDKIETPTSFKEFQRKLREVTRGCWDDVPNVAKELESLR